MLWAILVLIPLQNRGQGSSLKEVFKKDFLIGGALSARVIMGESADATRLVEEHFNTLTAENSMKWERIHPKPGKYRFQTADRLVELSEKNGMFLVGHTLVWHNQTPDWVFRDKQGNLVDRETLLSRMKEHIHTVVGRYRGRVHAWDVVNEAVTETGGPRKSLWYTIIGEDYVEHAFRFAHEADPDALLIYNDYSLTGKSKRKGTVDLVRRLQARGIRIDAVGMQGHYDLESPGLDDLEASIEAFAALGVEVMITELDISVLPDTDQLWKTQPGGRLKYDPAYDPYREGIPYSAQQQLADRYEELFRVFLTHSDVISRITFWGVDDGTSWKNNFPMRGRTDYALLFDRNFLPKPAFESVVRTKTSR